MDELTREERHAAYKALRKVDMMGVASVTACSSTECGLSWWKQKINEFAMWLGADNKPFEDPYNYRNVASRSISAYVKISALESAMKKLNGNPTCRICGSDNLAADPGAYYEHAYSEEGAPLLCLDHPESEE